MIYLVRWVVLHITIPSLTPVIFKEFKFYYSQSQYDLIFYNAFSILAKKKKKKMQVGTKPRRQNYHLQQLRQIF